MMNMNRKEQEAEKIVVTYEQVSKINIVKSLSPNSFPI